METDTGTSSQLNISKTARRRMERSDDGHAGERPVLGRRFNTLVHLSLVCLHAVDERQGVVGQRPLLDAAERARLGGFGLIGGSLASHQAQPAIEQLAGRLSRQLAGV